MDQPTLFPDQPIVFPDPISSIMQVTGATLLYFDHPLVIAHPATVIPQVARESLRLFEVIARKQPDWANQLVFAVQTGQQQARGVSAVLDRLAPLQGRAFVSVYFGYNAGHEPFSRAAEAATELSSRLARPIDYITVATASNDLCRHIFLQSFLEAKGDLNALFERCEHLFNTNTFEDLLVAAYMLRLNAVKAGIARTGVLLVNPSVTALLAAAVPDVEPIQQHKAVDVIAWEIFRCIVSPRLDPLNDKRITTIGEIRAQRSAERVALVDRCRKIAAEVLEQRGHLSLTEIATYVTSRIEPEIRSLFNLDAIAFRHFVDDLLSDKGTWAGISGILAGTVTGASLFTAAAAVTALASVGSAAYKSKQSREAALKDSDYRLLYYIDQRARPDG